MPVSQGYTLARTRCFIPSPCLCQMEVPWQHIVCYMERQMELMEEERRLRCTVEIEEDVEHDDIQEEHSQSLHSPSPGHSPPRQAVQRMAPLPATDAAPSGRGRLASLTPEDLTELQRALEELEVEQDWDITKDGAEAATDTGGPGARGAEVEGPGHAQQGQTQNRATDMKTDTTSGPCLDAFQSPTSSSMTHPDTPTVLLTTASVLLTTASRDSTATTTTTTSPLLTTASTVNPMPVPSEGPAGFPEVPWAFAALGNDDMPDVEGQETQERVGVVRAQELQWSCLMTQAQAACARAECRMARTAQRLQVARLYALTLRQHIVAEVMQRQLFVEEQAEARWRVLVDERGARSRTWLQRAVCAWATACGMTVGSSTAQGRPCSSSRSRGPHGLWKRLCIQCPTPRGGGRARSLYASGPVVVAPPCPTQCKVFWFTGSTGILLHDSLCLGYWPISRV